MSALKKISIKSHKFIKILNRKCELPRKGSQKPKCLGHIEFRNVNFAYPTKKDKIILHDLSMEVNPGEVVALVGESGGGKSTIAKLISYLYGPGEGQGEILLDGIPVSQWDANHFSNNVASVPQEPVLFSRSIRENISFGTCMEEEEIKAAAKMANAHEFIVKLDNGYDSIVGERGVTLSVGQRQRICIARALARKPTVLILDEATSSLDTKSEHLVHKAIDDIIRCSNNERRVSIVIIAHRLSTIMNADSICVINDGKIVEQGTHKKLIADKGPYFELVQQQRLITANPKAA
jgi:ATP-binding cassette subfamily B protein